jgi:hypothetical protein
MLWESEVAVRRTLLFGVIVFAGFIILMATVQFVTPNLVDNDGYYHVKMAYLMRTEGLRPDFVWLPLTVLNRDQFVDHHFLYHVSLIPFSFGDLRVGAKWAAVIFSALAFWMVWWLLYNQHVPFAALWALGLGGISEAFIYRMSMPRVQSLSLAVLVLALHLLLTGKYKHFIWLSFLYVWLYNAFPLILVLAAVYGVASWMNNGRFEWRPILYSGLGIILGMVINPYFPGNLLFIYRHFLPKLTNPTATNVGSEWFPYSTIQLIQNSGLALAISLVGVLALGYSGKRIEKHTVTSLGVAIVSGFMLFRARRFVEYFPAFALIFTAFALSPLIRGWLQGEEGHSGLSDLLGKINQRLGGLMELSAARTRILASLLLLMLIPAIGLNLNASRRSLVEDTKPYQLFSGASTWLIDNSPVGSRVFQTDWDDFPRLFFYNSQNTYTIGLDPTYMQLYDPKLYDLWVDITRGDIDQPSSVILDKFEAGYVVTDLQHGGFINAAKDDPGLKEVYRDKYAIVYRID